MDLPLLSSFTSGSHRVLEHFKEDVVEMGGHVDGTDCALKWHNLGQQGSSLAYS